MNRNPKVSIVIPVYNGSNYLSEAIESALGQTYKNIEVIVINDGSNDEGKTDSIAKHYEHKIRYFHKENGGVATALNLGIKEMKGKYFSWLSHDDVYYPNKIEIQLDNMNNEHENVIIYSDYEYIDERGNYLDSFKICQISNDRFLYTLLINRYINGCTILIPKTAFDNTGYFNEHLKTTQDYEMWYRLIQDNYIFKHLPQVLVKSRQHSEQESINKKEIQLEETNNTIIWVLKKTPDEKLCGFVKNKAICYLSLSSYFKKQGLVRAAKYSKKIGKKYINLCNIYYVLVYYLYLISRDFYNRSMSFKIWKISLKIIVKNIVKGIFIASFYNDRSFFKKNEEILIDSKSLLKYKNTSRTKSNKYSNKYKVLFLASWYPNRLDKLLGIFVKKHAEAVASICDVAVLTLIIDEKIEDKLFDVDCKLENNVFTVRLYYKNYLSNIAIIRKAVNMFRLLTAEYIGIKLIREKYGIPNIVHLNIVQFPLSIIALVLKYIYKIPYIITEHSLKYVSKGDLKASYKTKIIDKIVFRYSNYVTAVSNILINAFKKRKLINNKYSVIPNVVKIPNKLNYDKKDSKIFRFLTVSMLSSKNKNVDGIIKAFRKLLIWNENVELTIAGDGILKDYLENITKKDNLLKKKVYFTGYIKNDEICNLYNKSNGFVLNSNYETFSIATADAIAHGLPVVVSRCGGPEEYVTKEIGILVEKNNEEKLFEGMKYIINNYKEYDNSRIRKYAEERFSYKNIADDYYTIYNNIIKSSK